MVADAVHRRPAAPSAPRQSPLLVLTVVALFAWALLASVSTGSRSGAPTSSGKPELRLMAQENPTGFRVASFNVLGHSHTTGSSRYAGGVTRMGWAYRVLKNHRVDVVGFQELQPPQLERFNALTGKKWGLYPGNRLERIAMHNSIAWRTKRWQRVEASYLEIPYFKGKPVKMPVVTLRHKASGRTVYFANFHNPADSHGNAQKWRDQARRSQIALANRVTQKGFPLVITGDMNEREKYFCNMVAKAPMRAANGGSNPQGKPCDTPDQMGIDWIFGSREMSFTGYARVESRLVHRITDHPFIVARATIPRS